MKPEEITNTLKEMFGATVDMTAPTSWHIETANFRLLVLLSDDLSWLRVLLPIVPFKDAEAFLLQLLEANFDGTQETRYALHQDVLWGIFQHSCESLTADDFSSALKRLVLLHERGISECFSQLVEARLRQIIKAAKLQGQSLAATIKSLDRFYQEGLLGGMDQGAEYREIMLSAWRRQLEELWSDVEL